MRRQHVHRPRRNGIAHDGYAMVALLIALSLMSIMLIVALPAWSTAARREKEAELVFRGEQYARALALFSRKFANATPPTLDVLIEERVLRKKYKDPITGGDFEVLTPASAVNVPGGGSVRQPGSPSSAGRGATSSTGTSGVNNRPSLISQTAQSSGRGTSSNSRAVNSLEGMTLGPNAGVTGVRSKSKDKSLLVYNGAEHYNEWLFVARQAGAAGAGANGGAAGRQGQPGQTPQGGRGQGGRGSSIQQSSPFGGGEAGGNRNGGSTSGSGARRLF